jgi:hypothetical protein
VNFSEIGSDEMSQIDDSQRHIDANKREQSAPPTQKRKIGPTKRSFSGRFVFRGDRSIQFESLLEQDFLIRTEHFVEVLDIVPQPVQIPFVARNGRGYIYTPDFLVVYRSAAATSWKNVRSTLVEVKPRDAWRANAQFWLPKWKAAHRYAKEQGWQFHIRDETRIRDHVLENILFLRRYKKYSFPPEVSDWVIQTVRTMGVVTMHYLLAKHFLGHYRGEGIAHIWHLLATRRLDCDIGLPLQETLELWVPNHA